MQGLGKHLLVEFYGCPQDILNNLDVLGGFMVAAVKESGATYLEHHLRQFDPQGVSGVVIVAESHFAFHTWPEHSYMALDYFTCGESVDPYVAIDFLLEKIDPDWVDTYEHPRGLMYRSDSTQTSFDNEVLNT